MGGEEDVMSEEAVLILVGRVQPLWSVPSSWKTSKLALRGSERPPTISTCYERRKGLVITCHNFFENQDDGCGSEHPGLRN